MSMRQLAMLTIVLMVVLQVLLVAVIGALAGAVAGVSWLAFNGEARRLWATRRPCVALVSAAAAAAAAAYAARRDPIAELRAP